MQVSLPLRIAFGFTRMCCVVQFTNGQLEASALRVPKFKLFNKTNDRTKKRRVVVRCCSSRY